MQYCFSASKSLDDELEAYRVLYGLDSKSKAIEQLIRKGLDLDDQYKTQPTRDKIVRINALLNSINDDVVNLQKRLEEVQAKPNESDTLKEAIKVIQNECNKIIPPVQPARTDVLGDLGLDDTTEAFIF